MEKLSYLEPHPHRHHYRALILTFFVAIAGLIIALIIYNQKNGLFNVPKAAYINTLSDEFGKKSTAVATKPLPNVFSIVDFSQNKIVKRGEVVTFSISADSMSKNVNGYDVLLDVRGVPYKVKSAESNLADFTVLKFAKPTHITVTGVKDYGVKKQIVFTGQKIFTLNLEILNDGELAIKVIPNIGRETTKIVSTGTNDGELLPVYAKGQE